MKNKVQDFWNEWLPIIGPSLSVLLNKLVGVNIDGFEKYQIGELGKPTYLKYELERLVYLARKLGFKSIYILIDRVDEAELTGNNVTASFDLVKPLLKDLELLELDGIGFKFFLWDQLEPLYLDIVRTDRMRHEILQWDEKMLQDLWQKRLQAYSRGKVSSLSPPKSKMVGTFTFDALVLIFANHSPRDMIRIGAQIVAEQQEINLFSDEISAEAIARGIEKFCVRRATEIASAKALHDLRKVGQVDFTIPYLANVVFREKQTTTRNRLQKWRQEGIIADLDRIENPNPTQSRPVKLIGVKDIRIAKVMFQDMDVPRFLRTKYKRCPGCGSTVLRDWGARDSISRCQLCQFDLLGPLTSEWESWRLKELAVQARRQERREMFNYSQMRLFDERDEELS